MGLKNIILKEKNHMSKKLYSARFKAIMTWILEKEGGFSNHPKDRGGATKFGITSAVLSHARGTLATIKDVESLSQEEAAAIYHAYYWLPICGDDLPNGLDHVILDMAIHSGVRRALILLQEVLNIVPDGVMGPKTLAAINGNKDLKILIRELCARRREFLKELPSFITFGLGWENRLISLEKAALVATDVFPSSNDTNQVQHVIMPMAHRTLLMNGIGLFSLAAGFFGYAITPEMIALLVNEIAQVITCITLIVSSVFQIRLKRNANPLDSSSY